MRRNLLALSLAGALASGPLVLAAARAHAMIAPAGLERAKDMLSPVENAGCWRWGWHGWGWYPWCGWGGPGYYGWGPGYYGGGWGWYRGWGWHRGWRHRRWHHW